MKQKIIQTEKSYTKCQMKRKFDLNVVDSIENIRWIRWDVLPKSKKKPGCR